MFSFWRKIRARRGAVGTPPRAGAQFAVPPAPFRVEVSLQTDVGCRREVNEDCGRFVAPRDAESLARKGLLAVVADGMGGHSAGEVASRLAVEAVSRAYYASEADVPGALAAAFRAANREVYEAARGDARLTGMGTTCSALVLCGGAAFFAHIGDSRLYLVRGGAIYLLSEDESAVMEMVRRGLLTSADARRHPDKNIILRALGTSPELRVVVPSRPFTLRAGDAFVLCSDGLCDLVEDEEIREAVGAADAHAACVGLIALAKERGGHDNITVGVVRLTPAGSAEQAARRVRDTREAEVAR